jgi:acetyltransferase-like isoleucine patch superfamily enzyme
MINYLLKAIFGQLLKFYKKYKRKNKLILFSKYVDYAPSANIESMNLEIRKSVNKTFMKVGNDSLIEGTFVFEKETGSISIGDRTQIGASTFVCIDEIEIGNDVLISWGCTFVDNNSHSINSVERASDVLDWKKGIDENNVGAYKNWDLVKHDKITIKDKVWIGFNCIIVKGVTIGEGAVLGGGSVVVRDVAPYTLVMGNPAKAVWKTK